MLFQGKALSFEQRAFSWHSLPTNCEDDPAQQINHTKNMQADTKPCAYHKTFGTHCLIDNQRITATKRNMHPTRNAIIKLNYKLHG